MCDKMTSLQRVKKALSYEEPDCVPLFLLLTYHGAQELDMSLDKYFSKSDHVVKGQLQLKQKYKNDCLNPFYYGAIDSEAFGSEVIFSGTTPPNCGEPIIKTVEDIYKLSPPNVSQTPCLIKVLNTISDLRTQAGPEVPIPGTVISPFSLPIMQMGFDKYIELMYENPKAFWHLMSINERFCIEWANAQFEAGANLVSYIDPCAASSIVSTDLYEKTGFVIAKRVLPQFKGFSCYGLASEKSQSILPLLENTGVTAVAAGYRDDIAAVKSASQNKMAVVGNLCGIDMCTWDKKAAQLVIKNIIDTAAQGGGLIISESTGEIPYNVSEDVLTAISDAVLEFGKCSQIKAVQNET